MNRIFTLFLLISACSPRVQAPSSEDLKPSWLKTQPYQSGYYTGIGHSIKSGNNNYIQAAKKSALDDLISQIKVNVSSTTVLSFFESDKKLQEQYEQIIQTTAADEIEEFEFVDAWEDEENYWVYYRLSISRYHQIKEEQKRNATLLATDYLTKARESEQAGEWLQAVGFYFQALRSMEKYIGEAIRVTVGDKEVLLVNEIYASIQNLLDKVSVRVEPSEIVVNRRLNQSQQTVVARAFFKSNQQPVVNLPLTAFFEKGEGDVFPNYKTNEKGEVPILITRIGSKEVEQTLGIKVDTETLGGGGSSPLYTLITSTFNVPRAQVMMKVQRPVVYITAEERSLGQVKPNHQISNKLKTLLATNGFEFTNDKNVADLWFDVKADSEKGSVSGSIYITYLTGVIRVTTVQEGKEIYATTLDRVKGYGLDYDKSSIDAYSKAMETLEKDRIKELLVNILQ